MSIRELFALKWWLWSVALACLAQNPAAAQTQLNLWHGFIGVRAQALARLTDEFNASQTDYRVATTFKERAIVPTLIELHRAGRAPHMVHLDQASGQTLATNRNLIRPVVQQPARGHKAPQYLPEIIEPSLDATGRMLSLPMGASSVALFVNRELLAKAGIDPDAGLPTWAKVQEAALKILDSESSGCIFASDRQAWTLVENVLSLHDQDYLQNAGRFAQVSAMSFSNRLLIRHVGMLASWESSGIFSYFGPHEEASERFAASECAILAGPASLYPRLSTSLGTRLGIMPLPIYDDLASPRGRSLSSGNGLWVFAGKSSKDNKGVDQYLTYLLRTDNQVRWHQWTGDPPVTREAYEITRKSGFYEKNPWVEIPIRAMRANIPGGKPMPQSPRIGRVREILDAELEAVWARHKTPKEALDDASERGTRLLRGK
ncbi:MAG: extracellular solute-binding protein [Burkholderiales bacterium]